VAAMGAAVPDVTGGPSRVLSWTHAATVCLELRHVWGVMGFQTHHYGWTVREYVVEAAFNAYLLQMSALWVWSWMHVEPAQLLKQLTRAVLDVMAFHTRWQRMMCAVSVMEMDGAA